MDQTFGYWFEQRVNLTFQIPRKHVQIIRFSENRLHMFYVHKNQIKYDALCMPTHLTWQTTVIYIQTVWFTINELCLENGMIYLKIGRFIYFSKCCVWGVGGLDIVKWCPCCPVSLVRFSNYRLVFYLDLHTPDLRMEILLCHQETMPGCR